MQIKCHLQCRIPLRHPIHCPLFRHCRLLLPDTLYRMLQIHHLKTIHHDTLKQCSFHNLTALPAPTSAESRYRRQTRSLYVPLIPLKCHSRCQAVPVLQGSVRRAWLQIPVCLFRLPGIQCAGYHPQCRRY